MIYINVMNPFFFIARLQLGVILHKQHISVKNTVGAAGTRGWQLPHWTMLV